MPATLDLSIPIMTGGDRAQVPRARTIRQQFDDQQVEDIGARVADELARPGIAERIRPGASIAIAVGSRGIKGYEQVVAATARGLRALGAEPFIVPAMGSHAASTAEGQRDVLLAAGMTEETCAAPIRATMDTVVIGHVAGGVPIHFDAIAAEADGIVIINRIKAHTAFRGPIESGLCKMLVVGMGKALGVQTLHAVGTHRFDTLVPEGVELLCSKLPVLFGMGLVENGYGALSHIEAVAAEALLDREPDLLTMSRRQMATLLFEGLDVLVLDTIGKDISGQGFDPNVVGRNARSIGVYDGHPITKLVALALSEGAHGNGLGMGELDIVTASLVRSVDFAATYANVLATTYLDLGAIPMIAQSPADAVALACRTIPGVAPHSVKLVRARNTKSLATLQVTEALFDYVAEHPRLEFVSESEPLLAGDELCPWPS